MYLCFHVEQEPQQVGRMCSFLISLYNQFYVQLVWIEYHLKRIKDNVNYIYISESWSGGDQLRSDRDIPTYLKNPVKNVLLLDLKVISSIVFHDI